ncbi:bifunctional phosphoribosylaminoimidazolecarboxamide formyltransferase/IMP cyclohydrolase [Pelagibacteraceae bacterium]|nr:bifunctional phosphoribosylaminoimidazolecarboxamide formyltransferase/IMP cyclohydrolase [Pelagibacteraceae bacterium]
MSKIKNALISVSDKENLKSVLQVLKKNKINVISSGGTYIRIKKLGFSCKEISQYTGFKEMLDGRVKTLHPKIHSGILFKRDKKIHRKQMQKKQFKPIDLVIVNFYPFEATIKKTSNKDKIIDNIDIGGPSMVRSAAKNFKSVTVITDKKDYSELIKELKKLRGRTTLNFRKKMASKAFNLTAYYDAIVSEWFNRDVGQEFPERKTFFGKKISQLRYGENPHQKSSIYINSLKNDDINLQQLSGKDLSYNNYNDIFAGLDVLFSNSKKPSTVIIKHANPCGVSSNLSAFRSFLNAQASDPISAFGGIVACNYKINSKIALEINKTFFEVILAKGFDKNALRILKKKKNMRIVDISKFNYETKTTSKFFDKSFILQEKDDLVFQKKKLRCVTKNKPSRKELKDIEFAFRVCKYVKSNAIVVVKDNSTIGIGAGQQNRLDSCKIAVQKARQFQPKNLLNSIAASDAFFPFADGIKTLINAGIKTIVQPGGSIRDKDVIEAANKAKIKMIFTGIRHFNH